MEYIKVKEIFEEIAPLELGESWDNNGSQIEIKDNINKILFTLEINEDVIKEAIKENFDLIVTHHPLIFNPIKSITHTSVTGKYIQMLISSNINVYSAHTNFDKAKLGNNVYLASLLELENISEIENDIGVICDLKKSLTFEEFIKFTEKKLSLPNFYTKSVGDLNREIKKIAVCTGAGGELLYNAYKLGADLLLTGDVKFNIAQDAKAMNMCLIDAGHYGTEKIFSENIKNQFDKITQNKGLNIETKVANANTNPYND